MVGVANSGNITPHLISDYKRNINTQQNSFKMQCSTLLQGGFSLLERPLNKTETKETLKNAIFILKCSWYRADRHAFPLCNLPILSTMFSMYGGTPDWLTPISQRSSPLVMKATLYSCTSVTRLVEMSQPGCLCPLCSSWREGHSLLHPLTHRCQSRMTGASLINANACRVEHVLRTAHFCVLYVVANV